MKKFRGQVVLGILFLVLISCNDDFEKSKVKTDEITSDTQIEEKAKGKNGKVSSYISGDWTDASGKVHIRQYGDYTAYAEHPSGSLVMEDGYVLVGGGAVIDYGGGGIGWGSLLTESRPDFANNTWMAASKSHQKSNIHRLFITAVGIKLDGVSASELRSRMLVVTNTSGSSARPVSQANLPSGYTIIGGGAKVNWTGAGSLLTYSYPLDLDSWSSASIDHAVACSATITSYAIGIRKDGIPNFGNLSIAIQSKISPTVSSGAIHLSVIGNPGWANTCPGAYSSYQGPGRLLCEIRGGGNSFFAWSHDHVYQDGGYLIAYGIMVKKE